MTLAEYRKVLSERGRTQQFRDRNPGWRGGVSHDKRGYITVLKAMLPAEDQALVGHLKQSHVYLHRLVAARVVGRPLTSTEQVHHINGDKTDNRPENLKIFASASEHMRLVHLEECPNCGYLLRGA